MFGSAFCARCSLSARRWAILPAGGSRSCHTATIFARWCSLAVRLWPFCGAAVFCGYLPVDGARRAVAVLPMATFNTCLLGTLLISSVQNFNFAQMLGFALGSGIGYVLAVVVVMGGEKRLESEKTRHVPRAAHHAVCTLAFWRWPFTGLPATWRLSKPGAFTPWRSREKYFMCGSPAAAGKRKAKAVWWHEKARLEDAHALYGLVPLQPHGAAARGV